jgi:hypothetical protein
MKRIFMYALILVTITVVGQKKNTVALNLELGKTYNQNMNAFVNLTQMAGGQEIPMTIGVTGQLAYTVKGVDADGFLLESRYIDIGMKMKAGPMNMDFNTTTEPSDTLSKTMYKMMKALTTSSFQIQLGKQGRVLQVIGFDKLLDDMVAQFPNLPNEQRAQVKNQLGQSFGDKSLRANIEWVTAIFPDKPVAVGESWTIAIKNENTMTLNVTTQYTLKEVTDAFYVLSGKGQAQTDASVKQKNNGMDMTYDLKGTVTSEIKIYKQSGWTNTSVVNQNLTGSVVASGPQMPSGMTIGMTMDAETKITDF